MSEYQYYEFQAIDRPLDQGAQQALRAISSRARITTTSFTNHYEWGDLKADPHALVERWFDLHLYLTNWGTRRLIMRLPGRFLDCLDLAPFLGEVDWVEVTASGDNLIVDLCRDSEERDDDWYDGEDWGDGSGRLAALAPLRADVLSGDLRLFNLLWLTAVEDGAFPDDTAEPLPGIGPLSGALEAFADFFRIDPDLVEAAAESAARAAAPPEDDLRGALAALSEGDKTALLLRVAGSDPHVGAELRSMARKNRREPSAPLRTVGALLLRAREIGETRERAEAERREAERRRQAEEAARARRTRLDALRKRGAGIWQEIEGEIERRNPSGYDRAAGLLADVQTVAAEDGSEGDFRRRLAAIRARHGTKRRFIERLDRLERSGGEPAP
jgi:hypothetical protein